LEPVKEYGEKAKVMKEIFIKNGFNITYDRDLDDPLADGFYFTISYPGLNSKELLEELLFYGISAISLEITGSNKNEGLRACVSHVARNQFDILNDRLNKFNENHPV
jgi:hypothetical protein